MPHVSIIIPTYNRLPRLKHVLAGLEKQQLPLDTFEVIVISDGSTDDTNLFLQTISTSLYLRPLLQTNAGVAAARNRGIQAATGELVLFLDDDVVPAPDLLQKHIDAHIQQGPNTVVLGPMLTPADFHMQPWVEWEQRMLYKQYEDMAAGKYAPTARQFFTGNTSLERHHLLELGGFNTLFRRAEDVELAYRLDRAGLTFCFCREAIGYHYAHRSFDSWLATPYAYGRNDVIFWRDLACDWLLPTIWREYHGRHPLIRLATNTFMDRASLSKDFIHTMKQVAAVSGIAARFAYSAIFNLRYYQGVADELGGKEMFFDGVERHRSLQGTPATSEPQLSPRNP
jgi:GT2 family glycosyltransferase